MFSHLPVILFTGGGSVRETHHMTETPHVVKSGQYASYWNAFLLLIHLDIPFEDPQPYLVKTSCVA